MSLSCLRQAEKCLSNVAAHRNLNAFTTTKDYRVVLKDVETSLARASASPLQGKLVAIKDNICTTDLPTTCASRILGNHASPFAATVVTKLQAAGAVVHGKTNMDEFGMGSHSQYSSFGRVVSSVDPKLSAGGSSGGSAVAVATDQCYAALGTDTGGSVRLPAAYTGIVGFKPSYGFISRYGVIPYANSLDTVGILARNVGIVKEVFDAINDHDPNDPTSLSASARSRTTTKLADPPPTQKFRFGIPSEFNIEELQPIVRDAWLHTLFILHRQGHTVHTVSLPHTRLALSAYYVLAPAEASSNLAKYDGVRYGRPSSGPRDPSDVLYAKTRGEGFGAEVQRRILLGAYSLSATARDNYFLQAQRVRRLVQGDFNAVFRAVHPLLDGTRGDGKAEGEMGGAEGVDVLISPTAMSTPPKIEELGQRTAVDVYGDDVLTVPASLAGLPAVSIPATAILGAEHGEGEGGLPVGIQITGQFGSDGLVLRVAECIGL